MSPLVTQVDGCTHIEFVDDSKLEVVDDMLEDRATIQRDLGKLD